MLRIVIIIFTFFSVGSCISKEKGLDVDPQNYQVWIFMEVECPISQFYTSILNDFQANFRDDSVIFHAVFPHHGINDPELDNFIKAYRFNIPPIGDPNLAITKHLKATVTPEAFITKGDIVLYQGLIDNTFIKLGEVRTKPNQFFLRDALTSLTRSDAKFIQRTKAIGCIIEQ